MIRVAVCDDNDVMLENLKKIIYNSFSTYTAETELRTYLSGQQLMQEHNIDPFNVIFLDIDMPHTTGFDVAKNLRDNFSNCYIIFVTSHSELVYESMDFQPFNFIRKNCGIPLEESIAGITKKLMKHMKQSEKIILEDDISGRCSVALHDIIYIESDKHYVKFYIKNRNIPIKIRGRIGDYEIKYESCDFIRIHKQYLINLRYLSHFDNNNDEIILGILNKRLPMSKKLKKNVDEKYTLYLRTVV